MRKTAKLYMSYLNDFISLPRWAEYHGLTTATARRIFRIAQLKREIPFEQW